MVGFGTIVRNELKSGCLEICMHIYLKCSEVNKIQRTIELDAGLKYDQT